MVTEKYYQQQQQQQHFISPHNIQEIKISVSYTHLTLPTKRIV